MTQDHATAAPVCYRHPDRHTLLRCSRCGRPICASCSIDASVGQRCPECVRTEGPQRIVRAGRTTVSSQAPATVTLIAVAVGFFLFTGMGSLASPLVQVLAQVNALVAEGEWWRIFTPVLLHAGLAHILFNMWALWVLGPQVERGVGTLPFLGLFLASAGVGGVFAFYLGSPGDVAVGASGAIFGLFGVWFNWAVRRRDTIQGRAMLRQISFLLLINAAIPFIFPSISWQAHLGGLLAGFLIGEAWSRIRVGNVRLLRTTLAFAIAALAALVVMI